MNRPQLADYKHCTGCMACSDSCGAKAISCIINEEGFYSYKVNEEKCVLCHHCETVCPIVSGLKYGSDELRLSTPFAAWTLDDELRDCATSGGIFPALAKNVIKQGGVVVGAMQEQYYVHHECVVRLHDINKLQGSKYTQSNTEGAYKKVKDYLSKGRKVLFSGVGCQVAALLSFLNGNTNLDNLITVDLICGGVPSSYLIKRYIEQYGSAVTAIVSYRTKEKYALTVNNEIGKLMVVPAEERALPLYGFTTGAAKRYVCYDCPFAKGHRLSDITIGDYWGNNLFPEERKNGVSVAIVHTNKGLAEMDQAEIVSHKIEWRDFIFKNPRLVYGYSPIPRARKDISKDFVKLSYESLLEKYANKGVWWKLWTLVSRFCRIYKDRQEVKKRILKVESILKENAI